MERKKVVLAELGLLTCGILWGTGFVVMKNSLNSLPINWLLCIRFSIAALLLSAILWKKVFRADRQAILAGMVCGLLLYFAYFTQTVGLSTTTAGSNAFLTATYVVIVPFFTWLIIKKKPGAGTILAGFLCLFGVGVIALNTDMSINIGDAWTLVCAVLYALHIVCVSAYSRKGIDILTLTAFQFIACALSAASAGALFESFPAKETLFVPDTLFSLIYLGLICSLVTLVLQNVSLKYAPPAHGSLLMSTEAPFGCLAGIIFLNEPLTTRFFIGALMIVGAILLSEFGLKKMSIKEEPPC